MLEFLFFMIPSVLLVLFGISLSSFVSAKKQNKYAPGTFSDAEIKKRKIILIVLSVVTGVVVSIVIGCVVLMFVAVAYM